MKKILTIIFVALGLFLALWLINNKPAPASNNQQSTATTTPKINIQGEVEIGANGQTGDNGMVTTPRTGDEPVQIYMVNIKNMQFDPQIKNIFQGDSITFTNQDNVPHLIVSDNNLAGFKSPELAPGQSFTFKFDQVGRWGYHCQLHSSMVGTINTQQKALSQ